MSFTIKVIARHGDQFATLSCDTHKPMWGVEAANAVLQALLIFSNPSNRVAIQQELSFLSHVPPGHSIVHYHNHDIINNRRSRERRRRRAPFPFINTCVFLGMKGGFRDSMVMERSGTLQDAETSALWPVRADDTPYRHCVTAMIDITNLDGLRYCFGTTGYSIEDVSSYLARAPSWPTEKEDTFRALVTRLFARFKHMENLDVLPAPIGNSQRNVPPRPAVESLINLCIAKMPLFFQSTENIDTTEYQFLEAPHINAAIRKYCFDNPRMIAACQATGLLLLAFKGETYINLAPFCGLVPAAMRHVLQSCPEALSINLSGTAAMADSEIGETLAAIDHDLDALYLLTPPHKIVGTLPKEVMRALRNWKHRCSRLLISSVLGEGSRGPIPRSLSSSGRQVLHQFVWNNTHCVGSKSFPVTQIIYQSTFGTRYRPILAHVFLGGGFVSFPRLRSSILETIRSMSRIQQKEGVNFTRFLLHYLAWGSPTENSDKCYEVHSIPMEASFAVYDRFMSGESTYSDPGYHMCSLTPDDWTAVILRDENPGELPQDGLSTRIDTDRFRLLLLQPKQVIIVGEERPVSAFSFNFRHHSLSPNLDPSEAAQVLTSDQRRTVIQFQTGSRDATDAISAVQTVLDAAAGVRVAREKIEGLDYTDEELGYSDSEPDHE